MTRGRLLLLAATAALGSLAMHMVVPALPAIARELGADARTAQYLVAFYLAGLALGQLVAGPLADMFRRKAVLVAGGCLFCAASLLAGLANGIGPLIALRFVQALGGAAGVVSARALISDLSPGREATGHIAKLTTVVLLSPMIAPSIGGLIAGLGHWRAIFGVLAGLGVLILIVATLKLPPGAAPSVPVSMRALLSVYRQLGASSRFRRYAMANAAASSALYIFLGGSSFILIDSWGLKPEQAGIGYLVVTSAGLLGTLAVPRLERWRGAMRLGLGFMVAGSAMMLVLALLGIEGPFALLLPMFVVCGGSGMTAPAGITGAMRAVPGVPGTAASLAGSFQMMCSAVASALVGALAAHSFILLSLGILLASLLGLVVAPAGQSIEA